MFHIVNKQILAENVKRIDIHAPDIASKIQPGQFVNVCPEEGDERIPLTVVDADMRRGTISLIFQEIGSTAKKFGNMLIRESVFSILGPLGNPATIEKKGVVVCIATGIGAAQILPICRALKKAGNKVIGIIGASTKRKLMLEPQIRLTCDKIYITTEDGSYERRGLATKILQDLLKQTKVRRVYAIGSAEMMEAVCENTKQKPIETFVQLNPVMVDCMGMCGSCRVRVGGKYVLACIEGLEFDGHQVDFNDYKIRLNAFEESANWNNQALQRSNERSESRTFKRFLSDILSG